MNNTTTILIGVILIVGIGGFVFWQRNSSLPMPTANTETVMQGDLATTTDPTMTEISTTPVVAGITSAEVAAHGSRESCWSTINGNVYDLTSWIPQHPGGEQAILQLCGTDGSGKFNRQHGGAPKQAAVLFGFKIGVAAQ
ncbi:MAG: cytochrome b5 domain-containing protein [Patescibacteria group bacterium]|nr:cytochrome b5 domain-containing protein [Patescibacteria group bacterium]